MSSLILWIIRKCVGAHYYVLEEIENVHRTQISDRCIFQRNFHKTTTEIKKKKNVHSIRKTKHGSRLWTRGRAIGGAAREGCCRRTYAQIFCFVSSPWSGEWCRSPYLPKIHTQYRVVFPGEWERYNLWPRTGHYIIMIIITMMIICFTWWNSAVKNKRRAIKPDGTSAARTYIRMRRRGDETEGKDT